MEDVRITEYITRQEAYIIINTVHHSTTIQKTTVVVIMSGIKQVMILSRPSGAPYKHLYIDIYETCKVQGIP
jgi:hypothetical protein